MNSAEKLIKREIEDTRRCLEHSEVRIRQAREVIAREEKEIGTYRRELRELEAAATAIHEAAE